MTDTGRVLAVNRYVYGDELAAAASLGATTLTVLNAGDFNPDGGSLLINDQVITYLSADDETGEIVLFEGLEAAAAVEDRVDVYSRRAAGVVIDYVAQVALDGADFNDDAVEATIPHTLIGYLTEGIREDGEGEAVTIDWIGDEVFVTDILGEYPVMDRDNVDLDLDDVEAALEALNADLTELNEVTLPQLQSDLAAANAELDGIQGLFPITSTSISDNAITTPKLVTNAVTADKIVANAITTDKIVSNAVSADKLAANSVSADKIVANAVGTDKLAANAVTADKIAANAITAGKIAAGAISADMITSGTMSADRVSGGTLEILSLVTGSGQSNGNWGAAQITCTGTGSFSGALSGASLTSSGDSGYGSTTEVRMGGGGTINRFTSSERYKHDIQDFTVDPDAVLALGRHLYRRNDEGNEGPLYPGFLAEEAHGLGLTDFVVYDTAGRPDGFRYSEFTVALLDVMAHQQSRLDQLEAAIGSLTHALKGGL